MNRSGKLAVAGTAFAIAGGVLAAAPAEAAWERDGYCKITGVYIASNDLVSFKRYSDGEYEIAGQAQFTYTADCKVTDRKAVRYKRGYRKGLVKRYKNVASWHSIKVTVPEYVYASTYTPQPSLNEFLRVNAEYQVGEWTWATVNNCRVYGPCGVEPSL